MKQSLTKTVSRRILGSISALLFRKERRKHAEYLDQLTASKGGLSCDFGCGDRGALPLLSQTSTSVVGLDGSKTELLKAKSLGLPNVSLVIADCLHAPFKDNTFENVVCTHVLEHLIKPEDGIAEIYYSLKQNGSCFAEVPSICEVFDSTFSPTPVLQWLRAFMLRALDDLTYERKHSLLPKILFKKHSNSWELRFFLPQSYFANTLSRSISLNKYVSDHLQGKPTGLGHKHWFMPKEWLALFRKSELRLRAFEGIFCVYILCKKEELSGLQ